MNAVELEENILVLKHFAQLIEQHKERLALAATDDNWIPWRANRDQLQRGIATLHQYHRNAEQLEGRASLGGVAIFSSYNDPLFGTFGMSLGAALLVNGTRRPIVLKFPSMLGRLSRTFQEIVQGSGDFPNVSISELDGAAFMEHAFQDPSIGVIQVYGGPWVRKYAGHPARHRKALRFEGPGNNPAIVHASAELAAATAKIVNMGYMMDGQACVVPKRVLVDDRIPATAFCDRLHEKVAQLAVGTDPRSDVAVGPIKNELVVKRLTEQYEQAVAKGAVCHNWSQEQVEIDGASGVLIRPAVFHGVDHSMRIVAEETFGPVLTVMFAPEGELAQLANCTDYKLTASIFCDQDEASALIREVSAAHGMAMINQTANEVVTLEEGYIGPWGGHGISSFYIGPDDDWQLQVGAMSLASNFTTKSA